jgi:RNA recognition motif-containing protein
MATRLYVGNLSYHTTDQELHDLFSEIGNVANVQVMIDRQTGQSRGFGFVEMATDDEAQQAIAAINGRTLGGRALRVNESRPKEDRGGFGYSRGPREPASQERPDYGSGGPEYSGRESYSGGGGGRRDNAGRRGRDDYGSDRW